MEEETNSIESHTSFARLVNPIYTKVKPLITSINSIYRNFAISDTKTTFFVGYLCIILVSMAIVISSPVTNPFRSFDSSLMYLIGLIGLLLGHFLSTHFTNIVASKFAILACTATASLGLILHASFGLLDNGLLFSNGIVWVTVVPLSIIIGILSGKAQNSNWLSSALFMRHINAKLNRQGIEYLLWDDEGEAHLVNADSLRMRWDGTQNMVMCYYQRKAIPFFHFTPVRPVGLRITSAYRKVIDLFEDLNTSWIDILSEYRKSIEHSEIRTSWMALVLLSIPNDPNSLTIEKSKIPISPLNFYIGDELRTLDWRHPKMNWEEASDEVFFSKNQTPVLHTILCTKRKHQDTLKIESNFISDVSYRNEQNLRVLAQRTYFSLIVTLYHNVSGREGMVAEICRQSIRDLSTWFPKMLRNDNFLAISTLQNYAFQQVLNNSMSCDDWGRKMALGIENPSNLFFSAHNKLINYVNDQNCSIEIHSLIQNVIGEVTENIMKGNRKKPGLHGDLSTNISVLSDSSSLTINHKASVLCSALKLQFIHSALSVRGSSS